MKSLFVIAFSVLISAASFSQVERSSDLYKILKSNDSLLFNVGFNSCDIKQFEKLISDNFEFYHDKSGATLSKAAFIESIRNGLCKLTYKARRELIESSLEVYPLENNGKLYGAIQTGKHKFYALESDKPEYLTSNAIFTHIWLLESGSWKLSRGFSYDHQDPVIKDSVDESHIFTDRDQTDIWLAAKRVPALGIGYIKNGIIQEITVYGKNENGKQHPKNTIFNVASLTKPVTALVVLKLINDGTWSLDEPLYSYWTDPDVSNDPRSKQLTTRHILSHQSGFPNWRYKTDGKLIFEFDPGTKYQYSGEGFEYLRKAIENKFKKTLDQLASEMIFKPLHMNDTRFFWDKSVDESRFAGWYKGDGSMYETYKNNSANGADDLLTTVEDYSKFMVYIINGAGLKKDLYQQMISSQAKISPRKYFGLGWYADENINNGENALVHGGDDIGVHTIAFILPQSKEGLVIFTNCDNGTDVYIPTVEHYLGKAGHEIIDVETK